MTLRRLWAGALACLLTSGVAWAQVATTGTVIVTVTDEAGARVPGAVVTAESADTTTRREVTTNTQGEAILVNLEPSSRYVITTKLAGFSTGRNESVLVRSGQTTSIPVGLRVQSLTEEVIVTADSPVVDITSATQGTDISLDLTESLPTGRSYQSYLQLVPGVLPSDTGNPASKSGLNYSDIDGEFGQSRDNFYYLDGINVTDPVTGTFGANLNTEIIQEQKVMTGGIPAEFVGTPGLLSNVVTKSGSNTFHGSANYFFQNDGLFADNKNSEQQKFSTYDAAFTLGGPIVKDQAWFFASYRRFNREDDVTSLDTNELLRTVENKQDQLYGKATWAPSANDTLSVTFLSDPTDISGRRERDITNAADRRREQGGERFKVNYSRLFGAGVVADLSYSRHRGDVSDFAIIREEANSVIFARTDARTLADERLGGFGTDIIDERGTDLYRAAVQWNVDRHTFKAGVEFLKNSDFVNALTIGDTKSTYTSLANHLSGISAADLINGSFTNSIFDPFNTSDFDGLIATINGLPNRASFYQAYDLNRDGTITADELGASLRYNSSAGNPHGRINYSRTLQSADGPQDYKSEGLSFFAQDQVRIGRLTANVGVRVERFEHFNTLGDSIYKFDTTFAPRISAAYDLMGDGKQKVTGYYGKYYDPIRQNMTQFAGSHSGRTREEQVFINGQWVTYRVRGGASLDAIFAPETKTPWTDELAFGYQIELGKGLAFDALYTKRRTRDILEDYDPHLYSDPASYPGPIDHPDSLFLPYTHFGFDESGLPGVANFFIATLEGGKRDYQGVELTVRRRFADNWQALVAYTWNDAEGNTNSDSNADFQGDVLFLDPRAPNQYGRQPGSVTHLFKAAGSYHFDIGIEVGAFYQWNSGAAASRTFLASRRHLPIRVASNETFEFAGINTRWIAPNTVGTFEHPSYGQLDLRLGYDKGIGDRARLELFVDAFNVLDNQDAKQVQDLVAGSGGIAFQEPVDFLDPRRFFLGARISF